MILAFRSRRNICVDTHVHRIGNRLGWVATASPEDTERALYQVVPPRWWPSINLYLVTWGQNVCRPVHPRCGDCALAAVCPRIGVRAKPVARAGTGLSVVMPRAARRLSTAEGS
jgi:endonuclease III